MEVLSTIRLGDDTSRFLPVINSNNCFFDYLVDRRHGISAYPLMYPGFAQLERFPPVIRPLNKHLPAVKDPSDLSSRILESC